MLNNCHVCCWAGVLWKREGEEDPGDVCPALSPKATKSLGDGDFPSCPCRCSLLSRTEKGSPQNPPPRAAPACEPARGEIRGALWNAHVTLSLLWACRGLPLFFPSLFLFNIFPNETSKCWNYFETLRFHHLLYIALFTASYSIIIMIIPLSDVGISNYIS